MIVALIALFISLGGVSYGLATGSVDSREIKNNTIRTRDVRNNNLRGKDVRNNSLTGRDVTRIRGGDVSNGSLTGDDVLDASLGGPDVANGSLTGADLAADEAPHVVGAGGEPTLGNGGGGDCLWQTSGAPFNPVSFYRGKDGRVHLAGLPAAQNGPGGCGPEVEDARIFTLPPTYRPANVEQFSSATDGGSAPVGVVIGADQDTQLGGNTIPAGAVLVRPDSPSDLPQGVALDGLDFRAAGTGGFR